MSQEIQGSIRAFTAGAAIAKYARVTLSSGNVVAAGITDKDIGTALNQAFAAGDVVPVLLRTAPGTCRVIAGEALAAGALLYTEANGKVQDTAEATAFQFGHALEAAGADGDVIEAIRYMHGDTAAS